MQSANAGHRALRKGRYSEPGRIYLVTFVTQGRNRWFQSIDLACGVCRTFNPSAEAEYAQLLCWVLMPDHFHGLIQLHGERTLSQCVRRLKSQSTRACGGVGQIWARAYHDRAVRQEEDLRALARLRHRQSGSSRVGRKLSPLSVLECKLVVGAHLCATKGLLAMNGNFNRAQVLLHEAATRSRAGALLQKR